MDDDDRISISHFPLLICQIGIALQRELESEREYCVSCAAQGLCCCIITLPRLLGTHRLSFNYCSRSYSHGAEQRNIDIGPRHPLFNRFTDAIFNFHGSRSSKGRTQRVPEWMDTWQVLIAGDWIDWRRNRRINNCPTGINRLLWAEVTVAWLVSKCQDSKSNMLAIPMENYLEEECKQTNKRTNANQPLTCDQGEYASILHSLPTEHKNKSEKS